MLKELGLFYAVFLTFPLYTQWGHFITVQVTLTTPSHQVPSNFMLDFKRLHLNLLNIVNLLTLRVVLRKSPYHNQNNLDYLQIEIIIFNPHRDRNIVVPTVCAFSKRNFSHLIHTHCGHFSIFRLK